MGHGALGAPHCAERGLIVFDGGFSATSLAIFTALAPAGAVAFACVAAFLLARRDDLSGARERLGHALFMPIAIAWIGFIASATHLGTPANALHAISGLGRSPLSNEVVAAVAFLFFSGMAWMYSYRERIVPSVWSGLLVAGIVSAVMMLYHTSLAYSIATVPTWDTWLTPANLCMTALLSGPSLAALVLQISRSSAGRWPYALIAVSAAALIVGTILLVCHMGFLETVSNNVANAASLVPEYGWFIAVHAVLSTCGLAFQLHGLRLPVSRMRGIAFSSIGCAVVVMAALLVRFPFYAAYLSVGF